jgi:nucleotide-binding universal stress UspA family protein
MKKAKRVLVGLKTLEHATELTEVACRLSASGASLILVHVIELPDITPLDADVPELETMAGKILRAAERVARRYGLKFKSSIFRAHGAGEALLSEMTEKKTDLAVFGHHHKRTLGEILLGTSAQYLSHHAPCHVLFVVPPRM